MQSSNMKEKKEIFKAKMIQNVLISLFTIVLSVFLFECVFRVLASIKDFRFRYIEQVGRKTGKFIYDPDLGWRNRPNFSGQFEWPNRITNEKINSLGWIGKEFTIKKPDNVYRIAIIGCSITYGYGVNAEEAYPKELERLLNNKSSLKQKIEVLNFGVNGYGLDQMVLNYSVYVRNYKPDLVILQFYLLNLNRALYAEMWATQKPVYVFVNGKLSLKNHPVPKNRFRPIESWFIEKSMLYRFVKGELLELEQIKKDKENIHLNRKNSMLGNMILKLLKNYTDKDGVRLIVFTWGNDSLLQICRSAGVEAIDLYAIEDPKPWLKKGDLKNPPHIEHWSVLGHQYVAAAIYKYLKDKNICGIFQ